MTRVALDGLPLVVRSAGVATYTRELVRHLAAAAPDLSVALFAPRWFGAPGGHKGLQGLQGQVIRNWRYPLVMGPVPVLSLESVLGPVDLFHGTTYSLPVRAKAALVTTVHDLALLRHPELGTRRLRAMVEAGVRSLPRASRVIAVSEFGRDELVELCGIDPQTVDVVYNGCAEHFAPSDAAAARAAVAPLLGSGADRYILHVGTHEPRKNLPALIRAYARARREAGIPHRLILAGEPGWEPLSLSGVAEQAGVGGDVVLPGRVGAELLPALYAGAELFVFPSLYEGFGLPVVEAMASGVPVITSGTSALPEVAGDAALLVDPKSEVEIANAIRTCIEDGDRRQRMRAAGIERARSFTWASTAQGTLSSYAKALGRPLI